MEHVGLLFIDDLGTRWRVIERFENGQCVYGALNESNYILSQAIAETIEGLLEEVQYIEEVFFIEKGVK